MKRARVTLYHGGPGGLSVVLPPSETGSASSVDYGNSVARRDRVYATTDARAARIFAALGPFDGRAFVYGVLPVGETRPDPDAPTISVECRSANVVRVVESLSRSKRRRIVEAVMQGRMWP